MPELMISGSVTDKGWVLGRNSLDSPVSYPSFLRVKELYRADARTYFSIMEGPHKGGKASLLSVIGGNPSLVEANHDAAGVIYVEFDKSVVEEVADAEGSLWPMYVGKLWLGWNPDNVGWGPAASLLRAFGTRVLTWKDNPAPKEWTEIELPDFPHGKGLPYIDRSIYATTWFRLGRDGDRYLHAGRISAGCLTVDPAAWTGVYSYLIRRRKNDYSVGAVHVAGL